MPKGLDKAQANLTKAIQQQNNPDLYKEVNEFLGNINLQKYQDKFIDNGVEDLETILELDENHLEQMGVPLGHKLKIMKRIKETRKEKNMDQPVAAETKPFKKQDLEELPAPTQPSNLKQNNDPWTTTAVNQADAPDRLADGAFDEQ